MNLSNTNLAKPCKVCGKAITNSNSNKQFCSNACKQKFYRSGNGIENMETAKNTNPEQINIPSTQTMNCYNVENIAEIVMETKEMIETHFSDDFDATHLELFLYNRFKYNLDYKQLLEFMKWRSDSRCDTWLHSYDNDKLIELNTQKEYETYIAFNDQLRKFLL